MKYRKILYKKIIKHTPLKLRILFGPYFALIHYLLRIYIFTDKENYKTLTSGDTLNLILEKELSMIRFGDGELSLIDNQNLGFQNTNPLLISKLKSIFEEKNTKLLICIPNFWGKLNNMTSRTFWFSIHHLFKHGDSWSKLISKDMIYGDAFITRPFTIYKDKKESDSIFKKIFLLWNNKEVVLIEGSKSRLGVGNDLFKNVKSIRRILCPSENAFSKYNDIMEEAKKIDKDNIILLSLGPTAKILAYDLFLLGYRVLDIGHIDMEYEMFLRNSEKIIPIKYKYFNEINERNPEDCLDEDYKSQILSIIK